MNRVSGAPGSNFFPPPLKSDPAFYPGAGSDQCRLQFNAYAFTKRREEE